MTGLISGDELVEKVAAAIAKVTDSGGDWNCWLPEARAAIEAHDTALREPSIFDLLEPLGKALVQAGGPDIRGGYARGTGGVDIPYIVQTITALREDVAGLREALERADKAMTCRRDDDAHYCPNCDNSLHEARENIRAALTNRSSHNAG